MPAINGLEQREILERTDFLGEQGYHLTDRSLQGFSFSDGKICFNIFYERRVDASDVTVKFMRENENFSVGWLSRMMDGNKNVDIHNKLNNVLYLLDFIKNNFIKITDYNFCKKTMQDVK